jgi:pre-rRNA-processing protein TSR2
MEVFQEGIGLVLSRWSALRTAVENEWGGPHSHGKAQQLAADIFSWFTQFNGTINHLITFL